MLAELEVVIFFFAKLDLPPLRAEFAVGTAFLVSQELFLTNGVIAGLFVLVDLAFIEEPLQNSLNDFLVPVTGGLCPVVVLHVEFFPEIDKLLRDSFDEFSWRNACFRRGLLDFLAVLIDAGKKKDFFTFEPMIARNHIGQHHLVGVPDVRRRVRVIDRCGDEKCLRHAA